MSLKIRIKPRHLVDGVSLDKNYEVTRTGRYGCWFKNNNGILEYMEYKSIEQYINGRWENVES